MSTTTFTHMPGPRSRDTLQFKGNRILCFLAEYEFCTTAADLTPTQTIHQITHYCDTKSERFIKSLDEYYNDDWDVFKSHLLDYYPSEEEKPYYKVDHLLKLICKDRKLSSIEKFDNYIREFMVITRALEDRKALLQTDKYDYFWRGVKPMSFHKEIGNMMTDRMWPQDDNKSLDTMDSDNNSGMDDSDDEARQVKNRKLQSKLNNKQKQEENITKPSDTTKAPDLGDPMKLNIDNLVEKIGCLTIVLGQFDPDKVACRTGKFNVSSIKCFMCSEQGHSLKECPETKAFIVKKGLKISNKGHLVQLDGTNLPRRDIDNGGVDDPKGKKTDCPNRAYVELPQRLVKQAPPVDNPKVPTILKREAHTTEPTPALLNEDVEMWDTTMDQPSSRKQKEVVGDKEAPIMKLRPKTNPALEDIVMWTSPVYCFASKLQENVNIEALYKTLMDKDVMVKLGDILGSSFELCKRLQVVTKMQHIPVKLETAGSHNVEATVNFLERIDEIKDIPLIFSLVKQSPVIPPENLVELSSAEPIELKPGRPPKRLLINRPPKKLLDHEINIVAFKSDDSENNYASDNSGLDTDDQAEQFYR
ncbi:hypothetical protein BS47DRAFT_1360470 [Hydnum rufescens UP504]|uniref:CCHC-type domain-containing protein n=1 Tax=Hydnum rufescens UP504 TaxID=1448309 RepID=A0A9P6B1W4_9AGAM|nr:hypothetical protein BS47DRAFT_1360470 [Hydnum rufescens UP504]